MFLFGIPHQSQFQHTLPRIAVSKKQTNFFSFFFHKIFHSYPFNSPLDSIKKIIIPENIAIQLANSSEVSAENFFRNLYERYQRLQRQEKTQNKKQNKNLNTITPLKSLFKAQVGSTVLNEQLATPVSTVGTTKQITPLPRATTTANNPAFIVQEKDPEAYADDEDLETDYDQSEASGANRMPVNDTSIIYQFEN